MTRPRIHRAFSRLPKYSFPAPGGVAQRWPLARSGLAPRPALPLRVAPVQAGAEERLMFPSLAHSRPVSGDYEKSFGDGHDQRR